MSPITIKFVHSFRLVLFVFLLHLAPNSFSADADVIDVAFTDQNGDPIKDAVIIIPDILGGSQNPVAAVMDQKHKSFVPHVLAIDENTLVSFPNSDNIRHHVYSFSDAKRFEIKLYADTPEKPVLFDTAGIVILGCNIHDSMVGYIFVSKWKHYALTDRQGIGQITYQGELPRELLIWHPRLPDPTKPITLPDIRWDNRTLSRTINLVEILPIKKSRFR